MKLMSLRGATISTIASSLRRLESPVSCPEVHYSIDSPKIIIIFLLIHSIGFYRPHSRAKEDPPQDS